MFSCFASWLPPTALAAGGWADWLASSRRTLTRSLHGQHTKRREYIYIYHVEHGFSNAILQSISTALLTVDTTNSIGAQDGYRKLEGRLGARGLHEGAKRRGEGSVVGINFLV